MTWCRCLLVFAGLMCGTGCPPAALDAAMPRSWLRDLHAVYRDAQENQRPILVRAGAESCPWCQRLEQVLAGEQVQAALSPWTLCYVDVDKLPGDAQRLRVGATPALRLLTSQGRLVASHDGFLEADQLVAWLQENLAAARAPVDDVLLASGEPTAVEIVRVVRLFQERDAGVREAALRRLQPFPQTSASAVVNALRGGNLSSRLAAHDLLDTWQAPLAGVDPWRGDTLTEPVFAALEEWLSKMDALPPPGAPRQLTAEQLAEARRQIEAMLKGEPHEAAAIRERLARLGRGLLPELLARLGTAAADLERERLTALRYRLVADDRLVLSWPGGLDRLAATSPSVRHRAAEELAGKAGPDDQSLLLELFSDPDPLVREISLQGLKNMGGEQAVAALVSLLNDPDANVRAAVLKQLAADRSPLMLGKVAEYMQREQDPDLLVHAIRCFRETTSTRAAETLLTLLDHASWQVRAEAAEALGSRLKDARYGSVPENAVEIYDALLKLLGDKEPFVVSRAVDGLYSIDARRAVAPLVEAAATHPTLATPIIDILARGTVMRNDAVPHFRKFFRSLDPAVRAAAIRGLCETDPDHVKDDLRSALREEHTSVRTAAATSLLGMLDKSWPADSADSGGRRSVADQSVEEKSTDDQNADEENSNRLDPWLTEMYAGQHRQGWTGELVEPLRGMLEASEVDERLAAALALVPLGDAERSLPVLLAAAAEKPALLERAAVALKWLVWQRRADLFALLLERADTDESRRVVVEALNIIPDVRAAPLLWQVIHRPGSSQSLAQAVQRGLQHAYFGNRHLEDPSSLPARLRKRAASAAEQQLAGGSALQRLVAIDLLLRLAPDSAAQAALRLMNDESAGEAIRSDAFQISLAARTGSERTAAALEALGGTNRWHRAVALRYLATGSAALAKLPATGFVIDVDGEEPPYRRSGQPVVPEPPARLAPNHVRGFLAGNELELAAYAGYLLALMDEPDGLDPLLRYWRSHQPASELDRLVYRAVAVLDDARQVPVLKQIYARLDAHEKRDFYWTIRIMSGPEILALRKQIRDEVGVSNLQ